MPMLADLPATGSVVELAKAPDTGKPINRISKPMYISW